MRIAIIGSGISGLTCARLLSDLGCQVTLFERQPAIGLDAHRVTIREAEQTVHGDVPSRMFNSAQWPHLTRLYQRLDIETAPVDMSQSFAEFEGPAWLALRRGNRPLWTLGGWIKPKSRQILMEAWRLRRQGLRDLNHGIDPQLTFSEYLSQRNFSDRLIQDFLYPTLSSTVLTCSYESLDQYPAVCVLETLRHLTEEPRLKRVVGGIGQVVKKLLSDAIEVHRAKPVHDIRQRGTEVTVSCDDGEMLKFDHVVVATQANTALNLLPELTESESRLLKSFFYESITVFVHRDENLMPTRKRDWSTFNMLVSHDRRAAMCSVWMNRFHTNWDINQTVFQTINAFTEPRESRTISQIVLQRPVVNRKSLVAVQQLEQWLLQKDRRIWFCGSYANWGTPLLESGVRSAMQVVDVVSKRMKSTPAKRKMRGTTH